MARICNSLSGARGILLLEIKKKKKEVCCSESYDIELCLLQDCFLANTFNTSSCEKEDVLSRVALLVLHCILVNCALCIKAFVSLCVIT